MEHIEGYGILNEDHQSEHVEINLMEGQVFRLYMEEEGADAATVDMDLDEAQRLHEVLGHLLWQARQARGD